MEVVFVLVLTSDTDGEVRSIVNPGQRRRERRRTKTEEHYKSATGMDRHGQAGIS